MVEEREGAWRRLDKTHDNQMDNPVPHPSTEEVGGWGGGKEGLRGREVEAGIVGRGGDCGRWMGERFMWVLNKGDDFTM